MVKDIEIGNDIDLFIVGTEERAQMIMEFVLWTFYRITSFRTGNAVTFFVKDAINGDIPDHPEATHRYPTSSKGSTSNRPKRLSTVMLTDNYMAWSPRDGWNALERILSRAGANVDFVINVQNHQIKGFQPYIWTSSFREREYIPLR
jgi:hypothetical protein